MVLVADAEPLWRQIIVSVVDLTPIAAIVLGGFGLRQYRLSVAAEERQRQQTQAQIDVQLAQTFTTLLDIADGRREHLLSEQAVSEVLKLPEFRSAVEREDFPRAQHLLKSIGVVSPMVGLAAQRAAIASILDLGLRYPHLRMPADKGLSSLKEYFPDPLRSDIEDALERLHHSA